VVYVLTKCEGQLYVTELRVSSANSRLVSGDVPKRAAAHHSPPSEDIPPNAFRSKMTATVTRQINGKSQEFRRRAFTCSQEIWIFWHRRHGAAVPWNLQLKQPQNWQHWVLLRSDRLRPMRVIGVATRGTRPRVPTQANPYSIPLCFPHRTSGTQGFVFGLSTPRHCPHVRRGRVVIRLRISPAVVAMQYNNPESNKSVSHC
jgi:hypothetical protein